MRTPKATILVTTLTAGTTAAPQALAGNLWTGATIETEYAASLDDGRAQKAELIVTPKLSWQSKGNTSVTSSARLRADAFDRLEPGEPDEPTASAASRRRPLSDHAEIELRELYLDTRLGNTFLRLGKQETVWGQADGLKVLDVVNPQRYREFILDDFDDSRIPLWTAKWEIPTTPGTLQLLWIPDRTYHDLPESEDLFAFTSPLLVPRPQSGTATTIPAPERPDRSFADSDAGARWSVFLDGWDLTLNYLYHYRDTPVTYRRERSAGVALEQRYERTHLFGMTASNAFGDFTVRGEAGYSTDRFFLASGPDDTDGVVKTDELSYVAGLDWQGPDNLLVSGQVFQSVLDASSSELTRPAVRTDVTLLLQQQFWYNTLSTEVLAIHNVNADDGVVSPEIAWNYQANITVSRSADLFYGPRRGLFGQFQDLDRATLAVEIGL